VASADYFIDFHNAWIGSLSFALRDRILYQPGDAADRDRALALAERLDKMVTAYGHTVVNEYPAETYIREKLHRTASGSVLQKSRIPAFTAELGTGLVPDPAIIQAACAGTRNVMRWAGMLKDDTEAIEGIRVIRPGYAVRRMRTPACSGSLYRPPPGGRGHACREGGCRGGNARCLGAAGGQRGYSLLHEGLVLGRTNGVYFYPGQPIMTMAVRDGDSLLPPPIRIPTDRVSETSTIVHLARSDFRTGRLFQSRSSFNRRSTDSVQWSSPAVMRVPARSPHRIFDGIQ
jgi:hypothetical protein